MAKLIAGRPAEQWVGMGSHLMTHDGKHIVSDGVDFGIRYRVLVDQRFTDTIVTMQHWVMGHWVDVDSVRVIDDGPGEDAPTVVD